MSSFVYSGPPNRGFEPGATYELVYEPADPDWSPMSAPSPQTPSLTPPAGAPSVDPAQPSDETSKETS